MLLDQYLQAVRSRLPKKTRDDVVAELREALLSHIEAEQTARGGPLTDQELVALLKRYGAPQAVAARYGARDHLIGPQVYPSYRFSVKLVLALVAALTILMAGMAAFTSETPARDVARALGVGLMIAFGNLTIVTLVFARIERMNDLTPGADDWDPAALGWTPQPRERIARSETVAGLAATAFWLLWWLEVVPINRWLLWNRLPLEPGPIWATLTPFVVSLLVANLAINAIAAMRPRLVKFYDGAGIVIACGILAASFVALRTPVFVVVTDQVAPGAGLATLLNMLGLVGLAALALIAAANIALTIRGRSALKRQKNGRMVLV